MYVYLHAKWNVRVNAQLVLANDHKAPAKKVVQIDHLPYNAIWKSRYAYTCMHTRHVQHSSVCLGAHSKVATPIWKSSLESSRSHYADSVRNVSLFYSFIFRFLFSLVRFFLYCKKISLFSCSSASRNYKVHPRPWPVKQLALNNQKQKNSAKLA